ncbi:MAG: peptidoglycan binding protein CsiV [Proteobacteria bacterium]|nr:peptidoglycan binding protein CsiV [Pseudomonadota bacterium]
MFKPLFFLLALPTTILAQQSFSPTYVSLAKTNVYDVEIIIFTYNNALPSQSTYSNPETYDINNAIILEELTTTQELIKEQTKSTNNTDKYSIPLNKQNTKQALVWFEHPKTKYKLNDIWTKLQNNRNVTPLLHKSWRQPRTPFKNPQYVLLNTVDFDSSSQENESYPQNSIIGMVALSQGRFLHFGHKLNLFKQPQNYAEITNMVFSLTERKQVNTKELHYFDSPWFASIVKITKITGASKNAE